MPPQAGTQRSARSILAMLYSVSVSILSLCTTRKDGESEKRRVAPIIVGALYNLAGCFRRVADPFVDVGNVGLPRPF